MRRVVTALLATALAATLSGTGCRGRAAELLRFDASVPAPPPPVEEPHQVHYTFTGPNAVTFDWQGLPTTLRFWAKDIAPRTVEATAPSTVPSSSAGPWREAVIDGLRPGAVYQYQVGNPTRPEPVTFRAPVPAGSVGFRFIAVGDIGATSDWPTAAIIHRQIRIADPAFVLGLGDLTYADIRSQASVDRHFEDAMVWARRSAYMPVWGNHEWESGRDDLRNYKGRFALPNAAASPGAPKDGCCGEDWYWFDQGAVRFITYPEPYTDETWPDWAAKAEPVFAAAEADPTLKFVVTVGHRPAYSSGHHGGQPKLREILDRLGKRYGKYVLSLAGHSHNYERTHPQAHVVHVTAGTGGGQLEHAPTPCLWNECKPPSFSAFRAIHHGLVKVLVLEDTLKVEAACGPASPGFDTIRCGEGEIIDQVLIDAGTPLPPGPTSPAAPGPAKRGARQGARAEPTISVQ